MGWISRSNPWKDARTVADLGQLMADWIEGRIPSRPGYQPKCGVDSETRHLISVLAACNRAGYLTTDSQPGCDDKAFDGRPWRQRAAVQGYIAADNPLLHRLTSSAKAAGLTVTAHGAGVSIGSTRSVICTEWAGKPHTDFGGKPGRRTLSGQWNGIGKDAYRHLERAGVAVTLIDPEWGRDNRLWPLLTKAVGR